MQLKINLKVKFRESFRPFAPTVLKEKAREWFEIDKESPYMLLTAAVKNDKRIKSGREASGLDKLKEVRSLIPAVTHVDHSVLVQTLKRIDNPLYYDMIQAFSEKTGCPVILNTSFNVSGEPLVLTPEDAYQCFMHTGIDHVVLGSFLLGKEDNVVIEDDMRWQKGFALD
jgi:carbamoyltransferase